MACLFLSAPGPAEPAIVYQVAFGLGVPCPPGYIAIQPDSTDTRFFWKGTALSTRDRGGNDLLRRAFISGIHAELSVGLDNGRYQVELLWGDRAFPHGPFDVAVQGQSVAQAFSTRTNEFRTQKFTADVDHEVLRIRIVAADAKANFALAGMTIRGPQQTGKHCVINPPNKDVPTLEEIRALGQPDPRQALRAYCDWLLAHRPANGSFNPNSAEWYRSGYPVRTFLAGYQIFGQKPYLDAVCGFLDKLVSEQLPNGAWSSGFSNRPVAQQSKAEVQRVMSGTTNTADVGSISTCLAVAYPLVDPQRKARYLAALKRFSDDYAAQWQLPSGGFTNGRWGGKDMTVPYSVATGTQGMSFCALYAITREPRYLKIAERAAGFLLDNWLPDGRPIHHHHALPTSEPVKCTQFGDIYYYHEAILWVWHWTADPALKDKIRRVYQWHIKGPRGLLAARAHGVWWPPEHPWVDSKAAAMPLVFLEYQRNMAADAEVQEAVRRAAVFLCHPDFASRIGIMVDPELPWGQFSMAATGFGGLFLAEMVRPGVIFLCEKP
jgi:hypothetical protein